MKVRAARLVHHDQPLEIQEVELPDPGPNEVLVDLAYGGVNPVDRYTAQGRVAPDSPTPRTLGSEAAGLVDSRPFAVRGHGLGARRDGLWATAAVVPRDALVQVPEGIDLQLAAAMGVAGVTAFRCVTERAQVTAGDRVLVLGASGGVGSIAVSIAAGLGATVWGQTGSAAKADWVRERGAEHVVVCDADGLVDAARELRPTVVLDPLGDGFTGAAIELLDNHGRLVLFGTSAAPTGEVPLQQLYRKGLVVHGYAGLIETDDAIASGMRGAFEAARAGRLDVVVDRVLPLDEVEEAFRLLADRGVRGKLLLDLSSSAVS